MITKKSELFAYLKENKIDNKIIADIMQYVLNLQDTHEQEIQKLMFGMQKLFQTVDTRDVLYRGCSVCGVAINDGPQGYVCVVSNCPTRVSNE